MLGAGEEEWGTNCVGVGELPKPLPIGLDSVWQSRERIRVPTVALQIDTGELIGFLLVAGEATLSEGSSARDFVFTGVPGSSYSFDHPVSSVVQQHENVEHRALVHRDGTNVLLRIELGNAVFHIDLASRRGTWRIEVDGNRKAFGRCEVLGE